MSLEASARCPECGAELPAGRGAEGMCPACLLGLGLGMDSVALAEHLPERYRPVGALGRGAMGIVVKAFDTKLERLVALKLLAGGLVIDPEARERFFREARLASQLDHPNLCTIHEVGTTERGDLFIVMPFYRGRTVAELLRRGPLSPQKALFYAAQLAQGLARAHAAGIVHRDIKPANLLVTEDGWLKILDFGVAKLAGDVGLTRPGGAWGTLGYMAPEQLAGREVDGRTDLWALGVVLYEMFAGRLPFAGETEVALADAIRTSEPAPTELGEDLDRLVRWLLARDPDLRPASAEAALAALRRFDPVALALDAGALPSPAMVASAGEDARLRPTRAVFVLTAVLIGLGASALLSPRSDLLSRAGMTRGRVALSERAAELLRERGHPAPAAVASGFRYDRDAMGALVDAAAKPQGWERQLLRFWYRESPLPLVPDGTWLRTVDVGRITVGDPSLTEPGMTLVELDPQGDVLGIHAVDVLPGTDATAAAPAPRPTDPRLYFYEARSFLVAFVLVIVGASVLARRNLRVERADTKGARRLAGALGCWWLLAWILSGRHSWRPEAEYRFLVAAISLALAHAGLVWLLYVALEPHVRRRAPRVLTTWTRLFGSRWRDPIVGSDLLLGTAIGVGWWLLREAYYLGLFGRPSLDLHLPGLEPLEGSHAVLGEVLNSAASSILLSLSFVFLLRLLLLILRHRLAVAAVVAIGAASLFALNEPSPAAWLYWALLMASAVVVVDRFGLLALAAASFSLRLLWLFPLVLAPATWHPASALWGAGIVVAMTGIGFYVALAKRKILTERFFEA